MWERSCFTLGSDTIRFMDIRWYKFQRMKTDLECGYFLVSMLLVDCNKYKTFVYISTLYFRDHITTLNISRDPFGPNNGESEFGN